MEINFQGKQQAHRNTLRRPIALQSMPYEHSMALAYLSSPVAVHHSIYRAVPKLDVLKVVRKARYFNLKRLQLFTTPEALVPVVKWRFE